MGSFFLYLLIRAFVETLSVVFEFCICSGLNTIEMFKVLKEWGEVRPLIGFVCACRAINTRGNLAKKEISPFTALHGYTVISC